MIKNHGRISKPHEVDYFVNSIRRCGNTIILRCWPRQKFRQDRARMPRKPFGISLPQRTDLMTRQVTPLQRTKLSMKVGSALLANFGTAKSNGTSIFLSCYPLLFRRLWALFSTSLYHVCLQTVAPPPAFPFQKRLTYEAYDYSPINLTASFARQ